MFRFTVYWLNGHSDKPINRKPTNHFTVTKKELKKQYKQTKFPAGVFQIKNKANGKIFVAGNMNLNKIWNRHKTELKFGSHRNKEIQNDWYEYGEENFIFEIISELNRRCCMNKTDKPSLTI